MYKTAIIIPTLNGGSNFELLLQSLDKQTAQPTRKIILDSKSDDCTVAIARKYNWEVISINPTEFNHGGTRQYGVEMVPECEIVIFMTQDTILVNEKSLDVLVTSFQMDETVGAAYGRQLPHIGAGELAKHARLFNYTSNSMLKSFEDSKKLGIKAAFISNSFAAYKREYLLKIGGFPRHTILSEDTYVAAKMLLNNWKVYYCAQAMVYHSHDYNLIEEFRRYFDIGVFHKREHWIREKFGQIEGEGVKFIVSENKYLLQEGKLYLLPTAFIRTCLKYLGYRLGVQESNIPLNIKRKLSMHRKYWK